MGESTRPLPPLIPLQNGGWEAQSFLSSREYGIRALGLMPSNTVVPVIVVPGIMGTNLRAKRKPRLGRVADERNQILDPGQVAWRPPNGIADGLRETARWDRIQAKDRQRLLDPSTLEVDGDGQIALPDPDDEYVLTDAEVRQRGWGELHAQSYGGLLYALQKQLNQTFGFDDQARTRFVRQHWKEVMDCDPRKWGVRDFAPLSVAELEKFAKHYFPVYAVGYNWLEDCDLSSRRLERRILEIIDSWGKAKRRCDKVILVTHSMGGLVARACAKRIPERIAGVIHGVMPALGAPAAYRRFACGTEASSPSNSPNENIEAWAVAKILGETTEKTTPVLATSPGALELLPNHLYPQPWLHVRVLSAIGRAQGFTAKDDVVRVRQEVHDYLHLPSSKTTNPYDLYRDMKSWYRLVNPALADPAGKYEERKGGVEMAIKLAVGTAEKFHRWLGDFYHPNTYAFYGDDRRYLSYGQLTWVAQQNTSSGTALTANNVGRARFVDHTPQGHRRVAVDGKAEMQFVLEPQDAPGDGTVPKQSGSGPAGKAKLVFATQGYDHQGSYNNQHMLMLTLRLIVKTVQEMS